MSYRWRHGSAGQPSRGTPWPSSGLGDLYASGVGVLQDYVKAYVWFNLSAARGQDKAGLVQRDFDVAHHARIQRDELGAIMTAAQIADAQRMSQELDIRIPRPPLPF